MENSVSNKNCILIVDDDFINRELLKNIFSPQFTFEEAENGAEGIECIKKHKEKLCAIILDVEMPEMTGIEILEKISKSGVTEEIPTFLITAHDDQELVEEAYRYGVMDVVSKPVSAVVVERRIKSVIELFAARAELREIVENQEKKLYEKEIEMDNLNRATLEALAMAIEFRDVASGQHVSRIYAMTKYILSNTSFGKGLSKKEIEDISRGSIMHDVGKISISDVILNKPGKLTREEFEIMKSHTVKGADILSQIAEIQNNDAYVNASDIARHHHERWDGNGYPDGLVGKEISIGAQVVSIVDVYDALVSVRVYKPAYSHDEAVKMIKNGECGVFNPKLLKCFLEAEPVIRKWYQSDSEDEVLKSLTKNEKRGVSGYANALELQNDGSSNSVTDIMLLTMAIQSAYSMVIYANLTQNTYRMIDYERFLTHCASSSGVFDDLIEFGSATVPVSHRRAFLDTFSREALLKAYNDGKKSVKLEHQQYTDDGKLHWVLTKVLFVKDNRTGDVLEVTLSQYIDGEYKKREQTRKILTDALNLAEQANSVKYDFLSKMSHDIRTPLNAIIGMTTIIAANIDNPQKISECIVKVGTSSKHLLGIMNDILDYTKIENGSLAIHKTDFNIRDLVTNLATSIGEKVRKKHQSISLTVADNVQNSYVGDEYRIRQVVRNLLDNANKFTNEGGKISLEISVTRHAEDHDVVSFKVKDTGKGISKDFIGKLFVPFAQAEVVAGSQSTGLGLPIAQNLAHLMNGEIVVKSEVDKGSSFTFELPLEIGSLTAYSEIIFPDINVLVVDDEINVCEHTAVLLKNMGISAETANSGIIAIEKIKENKDGDKPFDIAIVDWKMPEMDGVETVRRIREIVGKDMLVAIMSAYDWSEIEQEAREAGVDIFIAKPLLETNLRAAIVASERILLDSQEVSFTGEKVLVAEDNAFNSEIAKSILEMKNLTVDIAENGKKAYEMFISSKPGEYTAILMDIMMPEMNGHEATAAIRESNHPEAKTIPIYAMTANAFRTDILEARVYGMNGHIAKPIDFEEVVRILQNVVKNKKAPKISGGGYTTGGQ